MTTNKNTIATRAIVIISKRDALEALLTAVEVGAGVSVEVEDDGAGVERKGVFTGMVIVCALLHPLVSPYTT